MNKTLEKLSACYQVGKTTTQSAQDEWRNPKRSRQRRWLDEESY
jgi:hypothetical protein